MVAGDEGVEGLEGLPACFGGDDNELAETYLLTTFADKLKAFLESEGFIFDDGFMLDKRSPAEVFFFYTPAVKAYEMFSPTVRKLYTPQLFMLANIKNEAARPYSLSYPIGRSNYNGKPSYGKATLCGESYGRVHYPFVVRALDWKIKRTKQFLQHKGLSGNPQEVAFYLVSCTTVNFFRSNSFISEEDHDYILEMIKNDVMNEVAFLSFMHWNSFFDNRFSPEQRFPWKVETLIDLKDLPLNYVLQIMRNESAKALT